MKPSDVPEGPIVVDTGVVSHLHYGRGRHEEWRALFGESPLFLSFASAGELWHGAEKVKLGNANRAMLDATIRSYYPITGNDDVAQIFGRLMAWLEDQLKKGGINDLWIAASALALDPPAAVATLDLNDFKKIVAVSGLTLIHPDL